MNKKPAARTAPIFAYQPALRPALPCVYGPVEFREFRDQLVAIDGMLHEGGIEAAFVQAAATEHAPALAEAGAKAWSRFARTSALALRCNLARVLTGLSYREFAVRTAESSLLQWFLRLGEVDRVKVPAKSTLKRFSQWVSAETMAAIHHRLVGQATTVATAGTAVLGPSVGLGSGDGTCRSRNTSRCDAARCQSARRRCRGRS